MLCALRRLPVDPVALSAHWGLLVMLESLRKWLGTGESTSERVALADSDRVGLININR